MLHIHTSNHLENLVDAFAIIIKSNPLPPLIQETIIVQSTGMERFLSMSLAKQLGVWANSSFPFLNTIVWRIFKEVLGHLPDTSLFEPEVMVWSLMDILPEFVEHPEFTELAGYLQNDELSIKHYQLAWRMVGIFDQYMVYRPTWLTDWEKGSQPRQLEKDSQAQWQALLWQALVERHGNQHRAKLRGEFFNQIQRLVNQLRFRRVSVFGISALPPFHLEVLAELGKVIDVHLFLLNPCQEYWGDIVSDSDMAHKTARAKPKPTTPEALYFEKGNSLLASMGKMGRDFIDMLNEYPHTSNEYFENPGDKTLLSCIQSDILQLRERGSDKPTPIEVEDKSLQIHACHSQNREVEVLHDQLLALFAENPQLLPKDIVVMVPEIETYAPFIEAVFATTAEESRQIPFSIADRSLRGESAVIETFFAILELGQTRFSVSKVLAILETEVVQKRFELGEADLDLIRHWIKKTGIRWGMDKADRERFNLPAFEENTWQAGLQRLLLGYALPGEGEHLFDGILPFDDIEGSDTLILGKLVAFIDKLFECVQALEQSYTLSQWADFLTQVLENFLEAEPDGSKTQEIRKVLNDLVLNSQQVDFNTPVTREVILECLRYRLTQTEQSANFITGNVLFCAMLPMRSIPFPVVCLLGMNDQAYPRPSKSLGFDLIAKHPQRGDRSRRQNDRYLFLESLLSARKSFYISYVGQSIHDNTVMPPSVLVSELLDYVDKGFSHPRQNILDYLVTYHPLQAFSPRYFNQTNQHLFSFSKEYCTASTVLVKERQVLPTFFTTSLPQVQPETPWKTLDINRLTRFFKNPTEFLLRERLGIELPSGEALLEETEPFEVRGLERYNLNQTLVEKSLEGVDLQEYQAIAKQTGQLPHGKIGDYVYSQITGQILPFVERVQQKTLRQEKSESVMVNLMIGRVRLAGRLGRLWRDSLIHYRCAKLKAFDFIQLWIHHLILNSLSDKDLPRHSILIGENGSWEYQPVANSEEILQTLLTLYYWQGLTQAIPFFPESSLTFVEQLESGKTEDEALYRAHKTWQGSDFGRGEIENDYYQLTFGNQEQNKPLASEHFKSLARQFFEPLLKHRQALE